MISISGLKKRFGRLEVLKGIDLQLKTGKITAIVGPNGSGKSTLIKCLLGLVKPEEGEIRLGETLINGDSAYRRHIGYMPQKASFPGNLTATEVVALVKDIRRDATRIDEDLLQTLKLDDFMDVPIRTLSGGTRQRVSAALAFLFDPSVLILDEPTAGLDPVSSSGLKDKILSEKNRGKTIILTSHIMSEIEELADHIVFLLEGGIHFEGDIEQILAGSNESRLERAVAQILQGAAA